MSIFAKRPRGVYQLLYLLYQAVLTEAHAVERSIGTFDTPETEDIKYYRMDMVWGFLSELKRVDALPRFKYLSIVAKLVLCIPHSNAGEEHMSLI